MARLLPQVPDGSSRQNINFLEVLSRQAQLEAALRDGSYQVAAFNISDCPGHDASSLQGTFRLLKLALCVRPAGLVGLAPPRQLWAPMASSAHKRTSAQPAGDTSQANHIAHVVAGVLLVAHSRGAWVFVEQPHGSHLFPHKYISRADHHFLNSQRRRGLLDLQGPPGEGSLPAWAPPPGRDWHNCTFRDAVLAVVFVGGNRSVTGKRKLAESIAYTPMPLGRRCWTATQARQQMWQQRRQSPLQR